VSIRFAPVTDRYNPALLRATKVSDNSIVNGQHKYALMLTYLARTTSRCRRANILPLWFLFSSFSLLFHRPLSEVIEWISIKLGHIHLAYEKIGLNSPGLLFPTSWGKNRFLGPTLKFDRTYLCNGT